MTAPLSIPALPALGGSSGIDTAAANTYTDINGLSSLKRDPDSPEALKAVAQQVEAMFFQMMLQSMREASKDINPGSNEMGMYEDMYDKQVSLSLAEHTDIGIGRLLKKQLSRGIRPDAGLEIGHADAAKTSDLGRSPEEFVRRLSPAIDEAAGALNLSPHALLAQAALESGWGQRMPRNADGSSSNNLFGIKAGEEWQGAKAAADTLEVVDGVATTRRAQFRSYPSPEASVADFAKLLAQSPRYRDALAAGRDPQAYIDRIGRSGYASDPAYANKLNHILNNAAIQTTASARLAKL